MSDVMQDRFQDEIEAAQTALRWIDRQIERRGMTGKPGAEVTNKDGVIALWDFGMPVALAVLIRDDFNYTILTRVEL